MAMIRTLIAFAAGAMAMTSVHAATPGVPIVGQWGGQGIRANFTATGVELAFDCGTARIAGPVIADMQGHFTAQGSRAQWRGGPQLADAPPPAGQPVVISGTIGPDALVLDLRAAGDAAPTRYTLRAGAHAKLMRCY
jgi:hypothetical protein